LICDDLNATIDHVESSRYARLLVEDSERRAVGLAGRAHISNLLESSVTHLRGAALQFISSCSLLSKEIKQRPNQKLRLFLLNEVPATLSEYRLQSGCYACERLGGEPLRALIIVDRKHGECPRRRHSIGKEVSTDQESAVVGEAGLEFSRASLVGNIAVNICLG
jgi:hypothetical protein